jgi:hypothetical protein
VTKVVPTNETLQAACRRAVLVARANKALATVQEEWNTNGNSEVTIPEDVAEQIQELITGTDRAWDDAILDVAAKPRGKAKRKRKPERTATTSKKRRQRRGKGKTDSAGHLERV